jgi:Tol biopolymer transport system component
VFSYGELRDEDYAVFSMTIGGMVEGQWTPESLHNFYEPDIASDDQRVLMESIRNGRSEIWYSRGKGQAPEFLVEGERPHWNRDASGFAFLRDGKIGLTVLRENSRLDSRWLKTPDQCYDLAYSPIDDRIVFCAERIGSKEFILAILASEEAERHILVQSSEPLEKPIWSPDAAAIVFSWNRNGNRDLWAVILRTRELIRLTRDPAIDSAPLWDDLHHRIVFISDRGRGLEVGSMFTIALPAKLIETKSESNGQRSDHLVR